MFASAVHMIGAGAVVMAVFWLTLLILGVSSAARALSERRDKAAPLRDVGDRSAAAGDLDPAGDDPAPPPLAPSLARTGGLQRKENGQRGRIR
jgi:hypothetical protein